MDIQSVKGWQWAVLGAAVGLGMGLGQLAGWQSERIGGEGFISQAAFERELHRPPVAQYPRIRNLVIQPAGEVDLLWLEHLVPATNAMEWRYEPAKLAAPRPYKAADSDAAYPGVRERLMQLAQVDSSVSFRYACM